MLDYKVKIGLAPMRRDVTPRPGIFNWEKAEERGHRTVAYIKEHFASEKVSFVPQTLDQRPWIYPGRRRMPVCVKRDALLLPWVSGGEVCVP